MAALLFVKLDVKRARLCTLLVALTVALGTLLLLCLVRRGGDAPGMHSSASPLILAQSAVRFQAHPMIWPLAVVLGLASCSFLLAELGSEPGSPLLFSPLSLLLLALALGGLWSANPMTMIVVWALYDLVFLLGQSVARGERGVGARSLAVNVAATVLLWIGVLVAADGTGIVQWSLIPPGGAKMTVWVAAGILRIGVYPLHFATPSRGEWSAPLTGILFLSPVLGWGLLSRVALINGGALPGQGWLTILAAATLVGGATLAWTATSSRDARPWIGMAVAGALLLASNLMSVAAQSQGPGAGSVTSLWILTWGATTWILVVTVLLLGGGLALPPFRWSWEIFHMVPALVTGLWIISLPLTLGISGSLRVVTSGHWGLTAALFVGHVFLVTGVVRWLSSAGWSEARDVSRLGQVSGGVALVVPGLALIVAGLLPNLLLPNGSGISPTVMLGEPGLIGWALWIGGVGVGAVLGRYDRHVRRALSPAIDTAHELIGLDWAYRLSAGAFDQGLAVIRTIDDILAGRGALLWSFVLFLSVILVLRLR